jgi:perosamine synthetase
LIPVNEPLLDAAARENVLRCLDDGWISSEGPFVAEFEELWSDYCGMPYGVAVCNGTAALELALSVLDLGPGDEVILPSFTIISCVLAILEAGATPVLVDCESDTWCMDVEQVATRITARTKAIMPVHIYGHPVEMQPLIELAERYGLYIIEDAAEAHGATYGGRVVGGFGDLSCFSFYANKIISTGEGGMVLARDPSVRDRLLAGRNLGFDNQRRFLHRELGHNYRMTNLQAAVGVAQVRAMPRHLAQKQVMAERYERELAGCLELQLPVERADVTNVYWMYGVVLDDVLPWDATEFASLLRERGVDTRPFFVGMHEQPVLQERGLFTGERYPNTERIARRGLYLPSGLTLTEEQQAVVGAAVRAVLGR